MNQRTEEPASPVPNYTRNILRKIALATAVIGGVYGLILGDLWLRAREAYFEGEKYMRWHSNENEKKIYLEQQFDKRKTELDRLLSRRRISESAHRERVELAIFDRDEAMKESSVKYAYIWYQTAIELFSPPQSIWVKRARKKMPVAMELWKQELAAHRIPFEDYMIE
ncbi:MAG: hypothetical protein AAB091_02485 [Elusimicrobiota bacterium]